jgi:chromosomal replication initiation ATPase DnaA
MHAIAWQIRTIDPNRTVIICRRKIHVPVYPRCVNRTRLILKMTRNVDVLMIDDVQFISERLTRKILSYFQY